MLQGQEIFVILLVALVVLGPQRLPDIARRMGVWASEFRKAANDFRAGLEAEVGGIREIQQDFKAPLKDVTDAMRQVGTDMQNATRDVARDLGEVTKPVTWVGPEPTSGPTSQDAAEDLAEIEKTGGPVTDDDVVDIEKTGGPVTDEPDDAAG